MKKFRLFVNIFSVLCLGILLVSCAGQQGTSVSINEDNVAVARVTDYPFDPPQFFETEKYADSVRFIYLETNADCLISEINEVFFTDQYILVVDARAASIFFFDLNGKYSHKIHRRGRGPGEYISLYRAMVDEEKETVFVYDIDTRSLLSYDFSGKHLRTIPNFSGGDIARDIIHLPSGGFLCYKQDIEYKDKDKKESYLTGLWKVDENGAFEKYIWEEKEEYPEIFSTIWYNLYRLPGNRIGFVNQHRAGIYYIEDDVVYKRVEFEMPDKTIADYAGVSQTEESYVRPSSSQEKGDYIFTITPVH
jgi:hypothetical protein